MSKKSIEEKRAVSDRYIISNLRSCFGSSKADLDSTVEKAIEDLLSSTGYSVRGLDSCDIMRRNITVWSSLLNPTKKSTLINEILPHVADDEYLLLLEENKSGADKLVLLHKVELVTPEASIGEAANTIQEWRRCGGKTPVIMLVGLPDGSAVCVTQLNSIIPKYTN